MAFIHFVLLQFEKPDKMKINWKEVELSFGAHSKIVDECKDTDYDDDGGFWDNISDWFWGEDFDYKSMDKAVGNFYNCCVRKLVQVRAMIVKTEFENLIKKSYFSNSQSQKSFIQIF